MAIIGHGDIASALTGIDSLGRIFFASGVSNSSETREIEFKREKDLLIQCDERKQIIYFSSLCVFYSDTRYAQHKREMERLVKTFPHYAIVRIGNITWGVNPNTLINFLRNRVAAGLPLEIQDAYRYIVDLEEFLYWLEALPTWNCEISIPGERMKVAEVVRRYVVPFVRMEAVA